MARDHTILTVNLSITLFFPASTTKHIRLPRCSYIFINRSQLVFHQFNDAKKKTLIFDSSSRNIIKIKTLILFICTSQCGGGRTLRREIVVVVVRGARSFLVALDIWILSLANVSPDGKPTATGYAWRNGNRPLCRTECDTNTLANGHRIPESGQRCRVLSAIGQTWRRSYDGRLFWRRRAGLLYYTKRIQ